MLEDRYYMRTSSLAPRRSLTVLLIIVNVVIYVVHSILEYYSRLPFSAYLGLSFEGLRHGFLWQLLTFQFLHSGNTHLFLNLLVLYLLGRPVEDALGPVGFMKLYLSSGVVGGLFQMLGTWFLPTHFGGLYAQHPVVGASAGVFGLMGAYAGLFPDHRLNLLFTPITFTPRVLFIVFAALAVFGIIVPTGNVAEGAHLGGLLGGLAYVYWIVRGGGFSIPWFSFRKMPQRPRELVTTASPKRPFWQRPKTAEEDDLPPAEFIIREVDPILDKISAHGIQSLTDRERRILEAARAKMAKR